MVAALFDTNILIDYLIGIDEARDVIAFEDNPAISIVTWMEVLVGVDANVEASTSEFLSRFRVVGLDSEIAERAVKLRRSHRLKLPDAIIWSTAQIGSLVLITRNSRDFPQTDPGVRIPYRL